MTNTKLANEIVLEGLLDYTFLHIMESKEPDAVRAHLVEFLHKVLDRGVISERLRCVNLAKEIISHMIADNYLDAEYKLTEMEELPL